MKLNSYEEKNRYYEDHGEFERWLFVRELKDLLKALPDDYWLTPNETRNLAIHRMIGEGEDEAQEFVGIVDFHWNKIDTFGEEVELKRSLFSRIKSGLSGFLLRFKIELYSVNRRKKQ